MMKRLLATAAVLATLTHTAWAGELTLFADNDFRGARVTLQNDVRDLRQANFNDRASSVVVRSGVWQLCSDSNFGGRCAEFGPGEYRELPGFNDTISSAREIPRGGPARLQDEQARRDAWREEHRDERREERREEQREAWRDGYAAGSRDDGGRGPAVELFAGPRFEGQQVALSRDVHSMLDVGFNDRATSMVIHAGRWEFCEHVDFRGECAVFGPGRYPFLEGMDNRISSMRRVR